MNTWQTTEDGAVLNVGCGIYLRVWRDKRTLNWHHECHHLGFGGALYAKNLDDAKLESARCCARQLQELIDGIHV